METDQWEVLQHLKKEGKLVMAPPTDDDDAYVLTIAFREHNRRKHFNGGAYCLSNDLYRDAQQRDPNLADWLSSPPNGEGGRISYAFVDMGQVDDFGQRLLDIVPNPRHPLVSYV